MRHHPSHRTLAITASMLSAALLLPASVLAAGPRDGTCDPIGSGPNQGRPAATQGQHRGQDPSQGQSRRGAAVHRVAPQGGGAASRQLRRSATGAGAGAGMTANRQAYRQGGPGSGAATGTGRNALPSGVLTEDQQADLVGMAWEEKLAHDLYVALGAIVGGTELPRIATAETQHMSAIRSLLARYGIADPTLAAAAGVFPEPFQATYDALLAQGKVSLAAAYDVGTIVEQDDLARIADAKTGVTAQDVLRVYANLAAASQRHLAAFQAL